MTKCEHGKKDKRSCKDCGGSRTKLCLHNKYIQNCSECNGNRMCIHSKQKSRCVECGGSQICIHIKIKQYCTECQGNSICDHGKQKYRCKECIGVSICEHNNYKYNCKDCMGSGICIHNKRSSYCKECKGSQICLHNKEKRNCRDCGGQSFCIHNKWKTHCKLCGGSALCKNEWCETTSKTKYEHYCLVCYINMFPDKPNARNYKTKEKDVVDRITQIFTNFTWIADKKVQDGCSRRRPDLLLDMGSYIIIVEIDENKHTDYDCSCENKRLMELSQDLQHRPIVFIRFNPDDYTNQDGILVKSCWKLNKLGIMQITKPKQKEWEERIETLKQQIQYWIDNPTEKTIEIIELFY